MKKIDAPVVRVVGEDVKQDIYPIKEAQAIADELELDLVEMHLQPIHLFVK